MIDNNNNNNNKRVVVKEGGYQSYNQYVGASSKVFGKLAKGS